jgi:hypothetical protein
MQIDQIIIKRFQELEGKAQTVYDLRELDFQNEEGKQYFSIPFATFAGWGTNVLNLLQRAFGEESVHYQNFQQQYKSYQKWESEFETCRSIFLSAKEDYEGGYLFNLRSLVKAEVLDDAFEQAKELLAYGYKDPACVLAGVSLEVALKDLCSRHGIAIAKLDKMNSDLAKAGIYNLVKQKQITAWADLRNKSAHGDWNFYNAADIEDMIKGVERFVADYL